MRQFTPLACAVLAACAHGARNAPGSPRPDLGLVAVVLERVSADVADSVVREAADANGVRAVSTPHLAKLSDARQREQLARTDPDIGAVLTLTPAFEPTRGEAWNEGSTGRTETRRSWRRFSARLVDRSSGRVLWTENFSNGPPVGGFLPTPDVGRAPRLVFAELRSAGYLRGAGTGSR